MERRVSIGRLMLAIGMFALAMTLLRAWLSPKNSFGFFGLLFCWIIVVAATRLVTSGRLRRFFSGASIAAIFLGIVSFIGCDFVLPRTVDQVVTPIESWFQADSGLTSTELCMLWAELGDNRSYGSTTRQLNDHDPEFWINHRLSLFSEFPLVQLKILLPQVLLSALVGLFFVACGRSQTATPRAAEKP
jgi:hypothetical protein